MRQIKLPRARLKYYPISAHGTRLIRLTRRDASAAPARALSFVAIGSAVSIRRSAAKRDA